MDIPVITTLIITYRGAILEKTCILERYYDLFLSKHFCPGNEGKQLEFIDIILGNNRISFDGKRKIADILFKKINKDFSKEFPDFNTDMNTVLRERNYFAHCKTDFTPLSLSKAAGTIGLIKFGVKTKVDYYDIHRIKGITDTIQRCIDVMTIIADRRPQSPKNNSAI